MYRREIRLYPVYRRMLDFLVAATEIQNGAKFLQQSAHLQRLDTARPLC